MDALRVPVAEADFASLVERVEAGEQVLLTRRGEVVAEMRPGARKSAAREAMLSLAELRASMPPAAVSSVDLVNAMRDEDLS